MFYITCLISLLNILNGRTANWLHRNVQVLPQCLFWQFLLLHRSTGLRGLGSKPVGVRDVSMAVGTQFRSRYKSTCRLSYSPVESQIANPINSCLQLWGHLWAVCQISWPKLFYGIYHVMHAQHHLKVIPGIISHNIAAITPPNLLAWNQWWPVAGVPLFSDDSWVV